MTRIHVMSVVALVAVGGSLLAECGTKSYTYEVALQVTGQGSAEVSVAYPGNSDGTSPKSTPQQSTSTQTLPFHQKTLASGLGHVSVSVKSADGQPVSCAITLEKDSPITKDGKGSVRCDAEITENTAN